MTTSHNVVPRRQARGRHAHVLPPARKFANGTLAQCNQCPKWFVRYIFHDEYMFTEKNLASKNPVRPFPAWSPIYWFQFNKRSRIKKAGFSWSSQ